MFRADRDAEIAARRKRIARVADLLACPTCGTGIKVTDHNCHCPACSADYPVRDGRIYFVEPQSAGDEFDDIKSRLRTIIGRHYRTVVDIVAPDFPVRRRRELRQAFDVTRQIVIDCGSGSQRIDPNVITLDFSDYAAVDIVCDICARLPFRDGSLDGATSWGVIEHLAAPDSLVSELARCIKRGGKTVHMVPFLYHFHSSPHDYHRYTNQGLAVLFRDFRVLETRNVSGPVSYFLLGLVEFGSIVLSFGNDRAKSGVYLLLCALTFPVKILDWPFINRKAFEGMAPCLLVVAEKNRA